jgi:predicted phage tail protein
VPHNFDTILTTISEVESLINSGDWNANDDIRNDLRLVVELSKKRIKSIYSNLLTQQELNNLQTYFKNIITYYNQKNYPIMTAQYINIKDTINKIPFATKGETTETLNKIVGDFIQKNNNVISNMENTKKEIEEKYNGLIKKLNILSEQITNKETQVNNIIAQFQQQFSTAQEERVKEFSLSQRENREAFNNKESERYINFNKEFEGFSSAASAILKDMEDIKDKIESIYGVVGKSTIIGTQREYANEERKAFIKTFRMAYILMIICAGFLIAFLWNGIENRIDF